MPLLHAKEVAEKVRGRPLPDGHGSVSGSKHDAPILSHDRKGVGCRLFQQTPKAPPMCLGHVTQPPVPLVRSLPLGNALPCVFLERREVGARMRFSTFGGVLSLLVLSSASYAATFGTVVPVRGTVSDIALDERRGRLYIANLSANRIEVMNTSDRTLGTPLDVSKPPSSVA